MSIGKLTQINVLRLTLMIPTRIYHLSHPWYNCRSFAITPKGAVFISFIDEHNPPRNYTLRVELYSQLARK